MRMLFVLCFDAVSDPTFQRTKLQHYWSISGLYEKRKPYMIALKCLAGACGLLNDVVSIFSYIHCTFFLHRRCLTFNTLSHLTMF